MIEIKRYEHKERVIQYKNGLVKTIPAYYECYYYYNGIEVAWYKSKDDVLCLKTKYIERDRTKSDYERALNGSYKEVYSYLFSMLGIDETSRLSEYMSA
jgi:hypothetical protein